MANCDDCWCDEYDKSKGNCENCKKKEEDKENIDLNVLLKRRAVDQMEIDRKEKTNEQSQSR